jgi:heparin/heparan-sulfate lyase
MGLTLLSAQFMTGGAAAADKNPDFPPAWLGDPKPMTDRLEIRPDRPRLYITPEELPVIRARAQGSHHDAWERIVAALDRAGVSWYDKYSVYSGTNVIDAQESNRLTDIILSNAFAYLVTEEITHARTAIEAAMKLSADTSGGDLPNAYRVWPEAIAYDWCHNRLEPGESQKLLANVRRQLQPAGGGRLESSTIHMGHLVNHLADAHLPAGIAFYEDAPDIFQRALKIIRSQIPAKNVFYRSGISSQGNSYGVSHYHGDIRMLAMLTKATGVDLFKKFPFYRDVGYYWVYTRRPDGQFLRMGDEWMDSLNLPVWGPDPDWGPPWLAEAMLYAAGRYRDPYLTAEYLRMRHLDHVWLAVSDIIWRDPEVEPAEPASLPTLRYLDGAAGTLLFRSGWGKDDVVGLFKVMPLYVKNHDHLDRLSFQIYCRGGLAIDSGIYEGVNADYGGGHWTNYLQRMLVRDPDEEVLHSGRAVQADGGQRFPGDGGNPMTLEDLTDPIWHIARVMAHGEDTEKGRYAFVTADATAGYGAKAKEVRRSFVFFTGLRAGRPQQTPAAAILIHDRVTSQRPEFEKVWLYHSIEEPTVTSAGFSVRRNGAEYGGALIAQTLLPGNPRIKKVGGPGNEFRVGEVNYATSKGGTTEPGAWRLEVSSGKKEQTTDFLHLFTIYPRGPAESKMSGRLIRGDDVIGVDVLDWTVLFVETEKTQKSFSYTSDEAGQREHLIIGLPADKNAVVSAGGAPLGQRQTGSSGSIRFNLEQGGEGGTDFRIVLE